jgi:hypothetical protein
VSAASVVPAGAHRPGRPRGRTPRGDGGAVTVEAAVALLALVALVLPLAWVLGLVGAQLAVGEAARAGARVAARGEVDPRVAEEARSLVPGASVEVRRLPEDRVEVRVRHRATPPGPLAALGGVELAASATALIEQP